MKPARENHERLAEVADAVTVAAVDMAVAAKVVSEEATDEFANHGSCRRDWAGLDSNQRRRKASRFTVCPVWPLRYLPVRASVDIGSRCAPRKWFGHRRPPVAVALFAVANPPFADGRRSHFRSLVRFELFRCLFPPKPGLA